jgi:hypothetical protein
MIRFYSKTDQTTFAPSLPQPALGDAEGLNACRLPATGFALSSLFYSLFPVALTTGFRAFLTTNHYPLTTAFTHPLPLRTPPPCLSTPTPSPYLLRFLLFCSRSLVPSVPCSLLFTHPPYDSGPHPPMLFCETVKL